MTLFAPHVEVIKPIDDVGFGVSKAAVGGRIRTRSSLGVWQLPPATPFVVQRCGAMSRPSLFTYLTAEAHASGFSSASSASAVVGRYGAGKKTVFVTGANSAIGGALCEELCRGGATVIMGYHRHEQQVVATAEQLTAESASMGGRAIPVPCDLTSMAGAQACASEVQALHLRLHAIVHCASAARSDFSLTCDGVEEHFAVNVINPLLLTLLLLPALGPGSQWAQGPVLPVSQKGCHSDDGSGLGPPPSMEMGDVPRVIWCTCSAHYISYMPHTSSSGCILAWKVTGEAARKVFMPAQAFGQSKLACVMLTRQLAVRAAAAGCPLAVYAVHPGVTQDGLTRYAGYPEGSWLHGLKAMLAHGLAGAGCLKTPRQAAAGLAYAALAPDVLEETQPDCWAGQVVGAGGARCQWGYLEDCALSAPSLQARSILDGDMLWEMVESMLLTGLGPKQDCPLLRRHSQQEAPAAAAVGDGAAATGGGAAAVPTSTGRPPRPDR